jgi:hypothetical protein
MGIVKAFLFSLLALVLSNLLLVMLAYLLNNNFDTFITGITTDFIYFLYTLFASIGHPIWDTIENLASIIALSNLFYLLLILALLLSPIIAALVAGRLGEKRTNSFAGFFLTAIVSLSVSIYLVISSVSYQLILGNSLNQTTAIINVLLGGLLNGLIFGLIAYLTTKKK